MKSSTNCPLCGSENTSLIKLIEVEKLISSWNQHFQIEIASYFEGIHAIQLFECSRCHLQYFYPLSVVGSGKLYELLEKFDWYYMPRKWEHIVAIKDVAKCKTLLEIGCGFGDFLAFARSEIGLTPTGIELNENAVEIAQRKGLCVHHLNLQEAAIRFQGAFDAVCSFQVLEHVPDTRNFLEWSYAMLKPGGKLIFGLPNLDSFLRYEFNILDMPPHHLTRWSSAVLSYLPNIFPLKLDHLKKEPLAEYHVDAYINAHCSALSKYLSIQNVCHPRSKQFLSTFLKQTRIRNLLTGHSIYACFTRI